MLESIKFAHKQGCKSSMKIVWEMTPDKITETVGTEAETEVENYIHTAKLKPR